METMIQWLQVAPLWQAILVLLAESIFIFFLAVLLGQLSVKWFATRRVALPAPPVERQEVIVAASTVLLNTVTTLIGLFLWRWEIIRCRTDAGVWAGWMWPPCCSSWISPCMSCIGWPTIRGSSPSCTRCTTITTGLVR